MLSKPVVILVSPKGPLNVGGVARLMGNFELSELRLVDPRCDLGSVECKQMAMQSYDIIKSAQVFPDLASAIADLHYVVALSGRPIDSRRPHTDLFSIQDVIAPRVSAHERVGLVFGREEIGLKLEELCLCHWQVMIPTSIERPSMNLTSAVALTLGWLYQVSGQGEQSLCHRQHESEIDIRRPEHGKISIFYERLHQLLEIVKFNNKENPDQLRDDFWALFHRADLDDRELRILFGILTSIEVALRKNSYHSDASPKSSERQPNL